MILGVGVGDGRLFCDIHSLYRDCGFSFLSGRLASVLRLATGEMLE